MTSLFKTTAVAVALAGAALFMSAPAEADGFSIHIGVPGVGFSYNSGGFCDRWGCPEDYWDYPVFYGPVYYDGMWFRGPVYYRMIDGDYWYWVRGGWHRDQWYGQRPRWWGHYRYGPALGYSYYERHGFRHDHDRWWHGEGWRGRDHRDRGWHNGWYGDRHDGWRDGDHRNRDWHGDRHDNWRSGEHHPSWDRGNRHDGGRHGGNAVVYHYNGGNNHGNNHHDNNNGDHHRGGNDHHHNRD